MQFSIDAIAFDLDGTLYPDYRLHSRLIPFALKNLKFLLAFGKTRNLLRSKKNTESGNRQTTEDFYSRQAAIVAGLLKAPPDIIKKKIETLVYRGWEQKFTKIKLFPNVIESLDAFKSAGFKMGVLSDFPPLAKLEKMGINSYWDVTLCSELVNDLKPDQKPFIELIRALNTAPNRILFVGNSFRNDISGA